MRDCDLAGRFPAPRKATPMTLFNQQLGPITASAQEFFDLTVAERLIAAVWTLKQEAGHDCPGWRFDARDPRIICSCGTPLYEVTAPVLAS
ncbi:hypothetical protein [Streptosporangium sp. NPDC002524]|uniref:hypothetical protein n=1 Tax=Streptosporangium sp. NPDC002524 TaxID=3154537 RepID=UPI00331FC69F